MTWQGVDAKLGAPAAKPHREGERDDFSALDRNAPRFPEMREVDEARVDQRLGHAVAQDPLDQRLHRARLADARRMHPDQRRRRPRRRGDAEALAEAFAVLLAALAALVEVKRHQRRHGSGQRAVEAGQALKPLSRTAGEGGCG